MLISFDYSIRSLVLINVVLILFSLLCPFVLLSLNLSARLFVRLWMFFRDYLCTGVHISWSRYQLKVSRSVFNQVGLKVYSQIAVERESQVRVRGQSLHEYFQDQLLLVSFGYFGTYLVLVQLDSGCRDYQSVSLGVVLAVPVDFVNLPQVVPGVEYLDVKLLPVLLHIYLRYRCPIPSFGAQGCKCCDSCSQCQHCQVFGFPELIVDIEAQDGQGGDVQPHRQYWVWDKVALVDRNQSGVQSPTKGKSESIGDHSDSYNSLQLYLGRFQPRVIQHQCQIGKQYQIIVGMINLTVDSPQLSQYENCRPQLASVPLNKQENSTLYSNCGRQKVLPYQEFDSASLCQSFKNISYSQRRKDQNKESAKKCREKKKQRQAELEAREQELQIEKTLLEQEIAETKKELNNYLACSKTTHIFNNPGRSEVYERLSKIVSEEDLVDEDEINLILDNLRSKVGAQGSERQGKINYIFKQIIHLTFPAIHRYLMLTAEEGTQYFGDQEGEGWMRDLQQALLLSQEQVELILARKDGFKKQYQIFSQLIWQMKHKKLELDRESVRLQDLIEDLRKIMSPVQSGKIITFIQTNKYKPEMELWVRRNIQRFSDNSIPPIDPGCRKRVKRQF